MTFIWHSITFLISSDISFNFEMKRKNRKVCFVGFVSSCCGCFSLGLLHFCFAVFRWVCFVVFVLLCSGGLV